MVRWQERDSDMKQYFLKRLNQLQDCSISQAEIDAYRLLVIEAMKKSGASEHEIGLIHDATIRNSIRRNRRPEEVAWAILQ